MGALTPYPGRSQTFLFYLFVFGLTFRTFCPKGDALGPTLPEARLELQPPSCDGEPMVAAESRERNNSAKKKCLYNFQDAFMEANRVVMATSSATSSVSCTATTVQSSNNQIKVSSKRPTFLGNKGRRRGQEPLAVSQC